MDLRFVKVREGHLEKIRRWRMKEEVTKYLYTDPQITPQDQERWYQQIVADYSRMDWVLNANGKDVGIGYLYSIDPLHQRCFWGYYLAEEDAKGKGIGKAWELNIQDYVFQQLNLHKLCTEVLEWNDFVIKIHERYGSKIEGVFHEHVWKRGEYNNVVRLAILRQDWEQEVKGKFQYLRAEIEEWEDKRRYILSLRET